MAVDGEPSSLTASEPEPASEPEVSPAPMWHEPKAQSPPSEDEPVAEPEVIPMITRTELLMMKRPKEARGKEVECLPAVVPIASLTSGAAPTPAPAAKKAALVEAKCGLAAARCGPPLLAAVDPDQVLAAVAALATAGKMAEAEAAPLLSELAEFAGKIAEADKMLAQAQAAPQAEDGEAAKWHGVAQTTLQWSRQELLRRQQAALERLVALAEKAKAPARVVAVPGDGGSRPMPAKPLEEEPTLQPPAALTNGGMERSMKKDLEALRLHDPAQILIVRKIKKLGWESPSLIRKHLEQYGSVSEIYVAHSMMKPNPKRPGGRARPAALGFVVMASATDKSAVVAQGKEQLVAGVPIEVSHFDPFLDSQDIPASDEN